MHDRRTTLTLVSVLALSVALTPSPARTEHSQPTTLLGLTQQEFDAEYLALRQAEPGNFTEAAELVRRHTGQELRLSVNGSDNVTATEATALYDAVHDDAAPVVPGVDEPVSTTDIPTTPSRSPSRCTPSPAARECA